MRPVVEILSPASSTDLVELATVKSELGISGSEEDARLDRLIKVAGEVFASREGLNRPPWRQTYRIFTPGFGGHFLLLPRYPVESVTSVKYRGAVVDASSYSIAGDGLDRLYRKDGWNLSRATEFVASTAAGEEPLDYEVELVAGWIMPDEAPSGSQIQLPSGLVEAALRQIALWRKLKPAAVAGEIAAHSAGTHSISFANPSSINGTFTLAASVRSILRTYA